MTATVNLNRLSELSPAERALRLRRTENDLGPYIEKVRPLVEAVRRCPRIASGATGTGAAARSGTAANR